MSSRRLKIAVRDHGEKSRPFTSALFAAGHEFAPKGPADLLLIDTDPPYLPYKPIIEHYAAMGAKVLLYPHGGGGPILSYDGLWEPDPRVLANMVHGLGHAEYFRRLDYPSQTHVVGWSLCDLRPFRATEDPQQVLFAPTHPHRDGTMTRLQREQNTEIFRRLLETPFEITVRHIGTLEHNGLWKAPGVKYVQGSIAPAIGDIDRADVVVGADGTFPTLAIARGVPTVVYGQGVVALGAPGHEPIVPNRLPLYWDYSRYPLDAEDGDLEAIIRTAALSEEPIAQWKRRFVGEAFDPRAFAALVERMVLGGPEPAQIDATRRFTALGFVDEMVENPSLLRTYAEVFGPEDDASLILTAPGLPASRLLALAERAIELAGIDADGLPDILLTPLPGSPATDEALNERADVVLTEWPTGGRLGDLTRIGAGDARALREAATRDAVLAG
jgi:hypothetical protein